MSTPTVVLDANVLFSAPLRDFLLRLGSARLFRPAWSDVILDETFVAIQRARPGLAAERLERTRRLMNKAFPEALIPPASLDAYDLPDVNDRHVLMTAVQAGAHQIVTFNLKDFPLSATEVHGVEAIHPDEFLGELAERRLVILSRVLDAQVTGLRRGKVSEEDVLRRLERNGIPRTVARLRAARR